MGIKHAVNENYFNKLTTDSAYLLGYIFADGNIHYSPSTRGKYVKVTSTDKELVVMARRLLKSKHSIREEAQTEPQRKLRYVLRIGSAMLFDSLVKQGVTERKSLTMKFPKLRDDLLPSFIRGYFDGDGSIMLERGKGSKGQVIHKRLRVVFTSGSLKFLSVLAKHLQTKLGLEKRYLYKGNKSFQIAYSTKNGLLVLDYLYFDGSNLRLNRKYKVYERFKTKHDK
jgi:hypothetical protein